MLVGILDIFKMDENTKSGVLVGILENFKVDENTMWHLMVPPLQLTVDITLDSVSFEIGLGDNLQRVKQFIRSETIIW